MKTRILTIALLFTVLTSYSQEICANAIDDDADGLIDLNDPDCDCNNLIDLSMIPNPSFEDTLCCPDSEAMLSCAVSWIQASAATSDYYNTCGFSEFGFVGALPPTEPLPGEGDGLIGLYSFLGGYREYIGTCTTGPLLAGVSYSLNFKTAYSYGDEDELLVNLFGSPLCTDLPWMGVGCPDGIGAWELLGSETVLYELDGTWQSVTISFTPAVDMNAIAFGGSCGALGESDASYLYFDELVLLETETLGYINEVGGWCSEDIALTAITDDPGGTWQWYKDGIALIGEITADLSPFAYGEGLFTAVYTYVGGCKQIDYKTPAIPLANFNFTTVCFGEETNFENLSTLTYGSIDDFLWNFDDGALTNDFSPSHLFASPGVYEVELILFSEDVSCNDTVKINVSVLAKPESDFELAGIGTSYAGDWVSCAKHELDFTDLTTIDGPVSFASWQWSFGDGELSSEQHPAYVYTSTGLFEIKLIVTAENGCSDSINQNIIVNGIVANFISDTVCQNNSNTFENLSFTSDGSAITLWKWYFGDESDLVFDENPTHLYEDGGYFNTQLFVQNTQGCQDSIEKTVFIVPKPNPEFYADHNPTDYFHTNLKLIMIYPNHTSTYEWSMPEAIPNASTNYGSVEVIYPVFVADNYNVSLIETNNYGCVDTVEHTIRIVEDQQIFAPNTFTPNGDPFNQDWGVYVEGFNLTEFRLKLFNRWGEIIWETNDPTARWNGTYFDGSLVQNGIYVWYIKARDQINDEVFEYTGFVNVLK